MSLDWTDRRAGPTSDLWTRRSYLVATAGLAALSGCAGGDGADTTTTTAPTTTADGGMGDGRTPPDDVSQETFEDGPVPDVYLSATSLAGQERQSELVARGDVQFSRYERARKRDAHQPGRSCGNCAKYLRDRNGDEFGACTTVRGYIHRADWCSVYGSLPEPEVPPGMEESDLATAEVPEPYRTAESQVGEARTPDDLQTHEEVSLTESVEAIAEGTASPGESCGTCAEFIPDKNGDGWGACAKVEGYIAVEDWCTSWEHVSAEL
jgi:hypothetical protein